MRRAVAGVSLAFAAALHAPAAMPADGGVAFVADISGVATIEGDGKLLFLAELAAGTRLLLGSNARAAITYVASGAEFDVRGPGEFVVGVDELTAQNGAKPARRKAMALLDRAIVARVSQSATASLRMRSIAPARSESLILFPAGTSIATLQPTLRLRDGVKHEGATAVVMDEDGKPLWTGALRKGEARLSIKLSPKSRYSWKVTTPRGEAAEARFETLSAEALVRVRRSEAGKTFTDRLVHAMLLQDLGANQEARETWATLARERPDLPELAAIAR
jgi:hypothetical protein